MWCTIVPKVEVHIKVGGYDSSKLVDLKTDIFGEDRETEVVVAKKFHMKIQSSTTQTGLQCEPN